MALRIASATVDCAPAYAWLEACRRPAAGRPRDDEGHEIKARGVLRDLVRALERDEPAARGHAERVAALSHRVAIAMGLSPVEADVVAQAGRLHDIGKVGVRVPCHCILGAQLVAPFEFLASVAPMIRHHHERLDGSGHPDGLSGLAIPLGARIIAIVDEYDRLTARESPGEALTHEGALARLAREAGRTLDSTVVSALADRDLP